MMLTHTAGKLKLAAGKRSQFLTTWTLLRTVDCPHQVTLTVPESASTVSQVKTSASFILSQTPFSPPHPAGYRGHSVQSGKG